MFEELCDPNDLEWSMHRLRVEVMTLKKAGKLEKLFRLYGVLGKVLAQMGNHLKAQDALNDQEFLIVEHKWRGTIMEGWCHHDRAQVFAALGRPRLAESNLLKAEAVAAELSDQELSEAIEKARAELVEQA